jgi:hypothetical protein
LLDFIPVPNSVSSPFRLSNERIEKMKQGFACQKGPKEIKNQDERNLNKEITDILQLLESKSSARCVLCLIVTNRHMAEEIIGVPMLTEKQCKLLNFIQRS